ncbi:MAG: (E)-4-hydroxy-3-methylbut-2-enyl-diphosphate synthase [Chlamydiota bacterium]
MTQYCEATYQTKRWKTRPVFVGNVGIGGEHPIRIQSMTTSKTCAVEATVAQVMRLADVGCDLARVTVQGKKEALACEAIKNQLVKKGYEIPLVADIHFYPPAALVVADFVDKVRINPGNFADRRATFARLDWDEHSYAKGKERIEAVFSPLVEKCARGKKAIRIGVNHGSLSDRIMNRYGDTPRGMVESALEFAEVCRAHHFHQFLFSMKSSHPLIMIQAYRLLVSEMISRGWNYPLHVGLTEAGSDDEGRVKSALAIGALLLDGLGDTIRVSLTEDPWEEVATCRRLVDLAKKHEGKGVAPFREKMRCGVELAQRRFVREVPELHKTGSVLLRLTAADLNRPTLLEDLGTAPKRADAVIISTPSDQVNALKDAGIAVFSDQPGIIAATPVVSLAALGLASKPPAVWVDATSDPSQWKQLLAFPVQLILLNLSESVIHQGRYFFDWLLATKLDVPVILSRTYRQTAADTLVSAASELGSLLADGFGEGVLLDTELTVGENRLLALQLLQAARLRTSQTEFISCPGCGRTLFGLQETTARIRRRTGHLPGVKIAVMGCIVNGPGEMADADFGYVGSAAGKVDLYVGKKCVEKGIPAEIADDRLIELIKAAGSWVEPHQSHLALSSQGK